MVDDILTEEVCDLLCGTYLQGTSTQDQMSLASWYPRCNLWETSGLQTGFWTGESERWYRERRQAILEHKAQPLSGNVWRGRLK
ncbi:hypothetical protein HYPSUDRAFT_124314, partial [Hypholoma sublateritium FD-334 SS-4]